MSLNKALWQQNPTTMMLKENLLHDDNELKIPNTTKETDLLDAAVKRFQKGVDHQSESITEKYERLAAKEWRQKFTIVAYTCAVALYIMAAMICYLASFSHLHGLMFALSILAGPTVIYQRLTLNYYGMQRELLSEMWNYREMLQQKNNNLKVKHEIRLQKTIDLKKSEERLIALAKQSGHSSTAVVMDLYNENETIKETRRALLEAITLININRIIIKSDRSRDHMIGDTELNLLAARIDAEGLDTPFTAEELCKRFRLVTVRSINNLAVTAQILYIEKRRQQRRQKERTLS